MNIKAKIMLSFALNKLEKKNQEKFQSDNLIIYESLLVMISTTKSIKCNVGVSANEVSKSSYSNGFYEIFNVICKKEMNLFHFQISSFKFDDRGELMLDGKTQSTQYH